MSLTVQELKEKIKMVENDLDLLRKEPGSDKKLMLLAQYCDYLKDELKELETK